MKLVEIFGSKKVRKNFIFSFLAVLIICFILIIELNIFHSGFSVEPEKSDVIIVLGSTVKGSKPGRQLKERIHKAAQVYQSGYAKTIIVTGSKGPGEDISEALCMKIALVGKGVKEKDILLEEKARNTKENLRFSRQIMKNHQYKTALIVTNYYHIYRSGMISNDLGMNTSFAKANMPKSIFDLLFSNVREVLAVCKYFILKLGEDKNV
jgi:uncharacterized SAM-binding protein YcdF (DUF218 family)